MRRVLPLLLPLCCACQAPFDVNRKDLGPFRIAAVGVQDGVARAAIWSGLGAWHEVAPTLSWSLDGAELGQGWDVAVPGAGTLDLVVTDSEGNPHEAQLSVAEPLPAFTVTRAAVDLGEDLSIDARRAASESPVDGSVAADQAERLRLVWPEGTDTSAGSTRWMSAGGEGSLLELETFAADVLAQEVVFDKGEVVERTDSGPGIYTQLALVIDGQGGNRWSWVDAAIGVDQALVQHEDRLLPLDIDTGTGLVAVTLSQADDLWGIAATDPVPVTDLAEQEPLACAPAGLPFRLAWVVEGRCPRPEVLGARVVLELR